MKKKKKKVYIKINIIYLAFYKYNNHYSNENLNYILLDLRISGENSNDKHYDIKTGFLPMTVILDQNELRDENVNYLNY
jgi:hypothetical protein